MLLLQPLLSHNYAGWANYDAFTAYYAYDADRGLFLEYNGSVTETPYTTLDSTKMYQGNPGLMMTYRTDGATYHTHGWGSWVEDATPGGPYARRYSGVYARDRFEIAATFAPTGAGDYDGLTIVSMTVTGVEGGAYADTVQMLMRDEDIVLQYFRQDTAALTQVVIDDAANWRGSPKQLVFLVTPVAAAAQVRTRVYLGSADALLTELTLVDERTFGVSASMNSTTNLPTPTTEYVYRWLDSMPSVPENNAFRMWSYTTEIGLGQEVDAGAEIAVRATLAARTSREVPLLVPEFTKNFADYATLDAFNADRGFMFDIGVANDLLDTTRPYTAGLGALRFRLRSSPTYSSSFFSQSFTGDLAGTTSWYVRQNFELANTLSPALTSDGDASGLRMTDITLVGTPGSGNQDRSMIAINDGEIRHVWRRYSPASTTIDVIDTLANWKAGPYQLVHWVEKVTATTWRVRIWAGDASPGYRDLGLLYDETLTSSFTDATVERVGLWTTFDVSGFPASDDWRFWIFDVDQGVPNYLLDPLSVFTETLTQNVPLLGTISGERITQAALTVAAAFGDGVTNQLSARASVSDGMAVTATHGVGARYAPQIQDEVAVRAQQRLALRLAIAEAVTASEALVSVRGVRVLEALSVLTSLGVAGKFSVTALQGIELHDALLRFLGAFTTDAIEVLDAAATRARLSGAAVDSVVLSEAPTYTMLLHIAVRDDSQVTDTFTLQQVVQALVTEQVRVLGSTLIPGTQFLTWAVNARTGATTEYRDYTFNSFARRDTRYLAAADDGLYVLDGDTDNGSAIIAELASGFLQFAGTRFASFKAVYLGMHATGNVFFRLTTGDGKTYTYRVVAQSMENTKVRVGKGLRARYFAFALETTGQDFDVDTIEFLPLGAQRRV